MDTREKIIYESLKLFSVNGYDAVSTRMIARAAGVSDTAMYKHFESKQQIFDTIIDICKSRFLQECRKFDMNTIDWNDVEKLCMEMFHFQTQDEWMVMFRRLLVVEQFKNPEMGRLYQDFFTNQVIDTQTQIFTELMQEGYMKKCNPRVLAMELYAPFFMYHTIRPDSPAVLKALEEHVTYFRKNYKTALCDQSAAENKR